MGMNPSGIFREQALKKQASPEQLDELIQITSPTGWLALTALGGLVVVAILWGILGSMPTTATGMGVFIRGNAINSAVAPIAGEVREINVAVGEMVTKGQRVGRVGSATVTSPEAGRVMQILAETGTFVNTGSPIVSLEPVGVTMQVVAYLPLADAKKVLPGMKAQVSPSTVKKEEFGSILGTVTLVAEFPSTQQSLRGVLVNDELIKTIANTEGPVEVRIDLERDSSAPSGYKWTSSGGPAIQISSGTVGSVMVITSDQMPISMILPWLKSLAQ